MGALVVEIERLVKRFGDVTALDGVDLAVELGEVHGFLGPNGAGKSTTIRVLLGLLRADDGTVRLLGGDPWRDVVALHRRLAYVPGDVSLWPGLTGGQAIDLLGNLRGGLDESRRARLLRSFDLDPTRRGRQYSKGNRQKVALVAALASDVELLILDEPTSGLDPVMEAVFQEEIARAKERGCTVLLSSHILSEVEALADRVSIIRSGRIVQTGGLRELRGQAQVRISGVTERPFDGGELAGPRGPSLQVTPEGGGSRVSARTHPDDVPGLLAALLARGLQSVTVAPPTLEELFLQHYGDRPDGTDDPGPGR